MSQSQKEFVASQKLIATINLESQRVSEVQREMGLKGGLWKTKTINGKQVIANS